MRPCNDDANPNPEGDYEIYVMDLSDDDRDGDGDNLRGITDDATFQFSLAWSPDGRKIAFNCSGAGTDVCLMDAEGSEPAVNLTSNSAAYDGEPAFSPDGTRIAFNSRRDGGVNNVFVMNLDGSDQTRITYSPAGGNADPEFSPDGTLLAFASNRDGDGDIYVLRAEPEGSLNVAVNLSNASPVLDRWPTWAPDGTKIAFWGGSGNGLNPDAEIYLMNADGSHLTNLTNTWGGDAFPDWGPARATVGTR